eukprot:918773-Prymnesium_polylepis.1
MGQVAIWRSPESRTTWMVGPEESVGKTWPAFLRVTGTLAPDLGHGTDNWQSWDDEAKAWVATPGLRCASGRMTLTLTVVLEKFDDEGTSSIQLSFKLKRTTPMRKLIDKFCEKEGVDATQAKFTLSDDESIHVRPDETPNDVKAPHRHSVRFSLMPDTQCPHARLVRPSSIQT